MLSPKLALALAGIAIDKPANAVVPREEKDWHCGHERQHLAHAESTQSSYNSDAYCKSGQCCQNDHSFGPPGGDPNVFRIPSDAVVIFVRAGGFGRHPREPSIRVRVEALGTPIKIAARTRVKSRIPRAACKLMTMKRARPNKGKRRVQRILTLD